MTIATLTPGAADPSIRIIRPIGADGLLDAAREAGVIKPGPPIDVAAIARWLGIDVLEDLRSGVGLDVVGAIESDGNKTQIWLNPRENQYARRKRFTLAHELGHFCLHFSDGVSNKIVDVENRFNRSNAAWTPIEAEANRFAAELLMPVSLLRAYLETAARQGAREALSRSDLISMLADAFVVSVQSMQFRLTSLGAL